MQHFARMCVCEHVCALDVGLELKETAFVILREALLQTLTQILKGDLHRVKKKKRKRKEKQVKLKLTEKLFKRNKQKKIILF